MPVNVLMSAIAGLLLLHVPGPPGEKLFNVIVDPTHTVSGPSIGSGFAYTINDTLEKQPVTGSVADIVSGPPAILPVTTPVAASMLASGGMLLAHTTVDEPADIVAELPTHTPAGPVIGPGFGLFVTTIVALQPDGSE